MQAFLGAEGSRTSTSYEGAARALGVSAAGVKTLLHRLRRRHGQLVRDEVARTVADPAQVEAEVRALCEALAAAGSRVRT